MGNVLRRVRVHDTVGTTDDPEILAYEHRFLAYLDTGSDRTIVTEHLIDSVSSVDTHMTVPLEGRSVPARLLTIELQHRSCPPFPIVVGVSDALVRRAGVGGVDVVLGQDYMQAARIHIAFGPRAGDHRVFCAFPKRLLDQQRRNLQRFGSRRGPR
ncbi:MAG TPA: hypothetical protein VEK07_06630 [Polyangiaceae bacterium]|nr:hypothetical protein [Polyangiaceae bacterium]